MNILKSMVLSGAVLLALASCNQQTSKSNEQKTAGQSISSLAVAGTYVTPDYEKRSEGYDWVGISVASTDSSTIAIQVRSRADKKKPTCTLDAQATKISEGLYQATLEGKPVLFTFDDTSVTVAAEKPEDAAILNFYCSGGASLAGTYSKTPGTLDTTQAAK